MRAKLTGVCVGGISFAALAVIGAGEAVRSPQPREISFNRDIRPILAENCLLCHGPDPGTRKAGLRLDTEAGLFEKRKDDPAPVVKGDASQSELYKRLLSTDKDEVMPPPDSHKSLKPSEIALLKRWIDAGAPWQKHWSFIPPEKAALPAVKNSAWVKNPIDQFVLAKLEERGLSPAPEAGGKVFFRRLHLDITGLPPQPADMEAFLADYTAKKEQAVSQWVDRLMGSSAWGEHRGRYWLDAARYGDTHGLHIDNYREMWMYRDWVIRAFNANKPFSEFTVEQIAGDLLPKPSEDQLIATGFQRCNITTSEGGTIVEENLANYAADRVQTIGWVYLGLTTNCAQCHDHKFDPFTQRDYYSMSAFFRNTTQGGMDGNAKDGRGPVLTVPSDQDRPRWEALPGLIAGATKEIADRKASLAKDKAFQEWLAAATVDSVRNELPSKDLVLRAPLNEGKEAKARFYGAVEGEAVVAGTLGWLAQGKFGEAPEFKSGASLTLGDAGDLGPGRAFSFGAWVRVGKPGGSGAILTRMDEKDAQRGVELQQSGNSFYVQLAEKFPQKAIKVATVLTVKPGTWQHVFVTYDGSGTAAGVKVFVDGKDERLKIVNNSLTPACDLTPKSGWLVGKRAGGLALEGGSVQDVRVYGRALSAGDVKELAKAPAVFEAVALETAKRSGPQRTLIMDHYLQSFDEAYREGSLRLASMEAERSEIKERSPLTHIQEEVKGKMPMAKILMRGQYNKLGEEVEAVPPAALHPLPEEAPKNRLGLAMWLVDKRNPLTPRVTVNRFWQEVFGQGIVRTSEDFGLMGAAASHMEMLDWLAADFRDSGGDVRRLFKLMLTSATYRQSAATTAEKLEKDRDNALLSRGPRFRMDAEMVRDYALSVSGVMSRKMYGPAVRPYQPEGIWDVVGLPNGDTRKYVQDKGESLYRRSMYSFWKRMAHPPSLDIFNAPNRDMSCVRRERTNTPLQALVTLNDTQFVEAARLLAEDALRTSGADDQKSLDYIFKRAVLREPSVQEREILLGSRKDFMAHYSDKPEDAKALLSVGERVPDASLAAPLLASWTMVCNEVLNLDEVLNK